MPHTRARRSVLSVPAGNPRMLTKSLGLPTDEIMFDLEDAIAASTKEEARTALAEFLGTVDAPRPQLAVRVNDVTTAWALEDVRTLVRAAGTVIDTIVLPKAERLADVHWLDLTLTQLEAAGGLPTGKIGIQAQIEGPAGLDLASDLATASSRMRSLVFGPGDFSTGMGLPSFDFTASPGRLVPLDLARWQMAVACKRHGIHAIDGPYPEIRDDAGCRASAKQAMSMGFDGKWALHPQQVEIMNQAFSPSHSETTRAAEILGAIEQEQRGENRGALLHGDTMIDEATRKWAASVMARASTQVDPR